MSRFISILAQISLMIFATVAVLQTGANAGSLDERFKVSLNTAIQNVKETDDAAAKRQMLGNFLTRMDQGIGMAKGVVSEKDGRALNVLQLKMQADYAELNGIGAAKVPDSDLNGFANYVQQDVEQAYHGGIFISGCGLILILILLILFLR